MKPWLSVVGIGEDGWDGLCGVARAALESAEVIIGSERQLALLGNTPAQRVVWPSAIAAYATELRARYRGRALAVLASGDPMLYGIGATLTRFVPVEELCVIPHLSAFSLACARLAWPSAEVTLVSAVARPLEPLIAQLAPGRRIVVYSEDGTTPDRIAQLLTDHGYGASTFSVLEHLGGAREGRIDATAATWEPRVCARLNLVALTALPDVGTLPRSPVCGLPDDAFESDGALTKREIRAITLAMLAPLPGELLWDVGAGSGSIGIEWMRADRSCRCIAFERNPERAQRIARNAAHLGVPGLRVVVGAALESLREMEQPDAVFIGGGIDRPGIFEASWDALRRGGRVVANAVTIEGESRLASLHAAHGGELARIAVSRAESLGSMLTYRPMLPITQWHVRKP